MTNEIERYFEVCGYQPDDLIGLGTRAGAEGNIQFTVKTVTEATKLIGYQGHINVWFNACPIDRPEKGRGTAQDVTRVSALWADLDVKEGGRAVRAMRSMGDAWSVVNEVSMLIGARPVAIVLSGHGLQPRWRLTEDLPNDHQETARVVRDFNRLVDHVASRFDGGADVVGDLARILRAPGTTNLKPGLDPVVVQVQFPSANQEDRVELWALQDAFDDYLEPVVEFEPSTAPRATSVSLARGSKWLQAALTGIAEDLDAARNWAPGQTDERGRGWEKLTADVAGRLASLAKAEFTPLTEEEAHTFLLNHAPYGPGWGNAEIEKKWRREWAKAEPAEAPIEKKVQHDDPLDDGYVAPGGVGGGGSPALPGEGVPGSDGAVWPVFAQTDKGYAMRIAHRLGDRVRFSPKLDSWLRYDDGRWIEDKLGGQWAALKLIEELYDLEGGQYDDTNEYQIGNRVTTDRREFARWCRGQEATSRVKAASDSLKASGELNVELSEFEANPLLVNAANCVVDAITGETMPHAPELMMRKKLAVAYDADAKCPEFEAFLLQALPNPELRAYLARIVGYSLTGSTVQQVVFMHRGPTASGKSVFLRVLSSMMGEYGRPMPESLLLHKNTEAHPTGIAGLEGCRVVFTDETPQGARWDESLLKRLTGETPITARGMHQDFRDFRLVAKAHIVTNFPPHVTADEATHRRLLLMPWDVTVPLQERDKHLADRIVGNELPGVLAWAVRGAQDWQRIGGLAEPADAAAARMTYFQEEDEFGQWLEECTTDTGADGFITPTMTLYQSYEAWAGRRRINKPLAFASFSRELPKRGKVKGRTAKANGYRMALNAALEAADPLEGGRRW